MEKNLLVKVTLLILALQGAPGLAHCEDRAMDYAFDYPRTSEHVLLEYRQEGGFTPAKWIDGQIVHPSRAFLRIYGDGRAHAHHPDYYKNPGDHFFQLAESDVYALLSFLADRGIFDLEDGSNSRELEVVRAGGVDAGSMILKVKLDSFERLPSMDQNGAQKRQVGTPAKQRIEDVDLRITLEAIEGGALANPDVQSLQDLAAVDKELLNILFEAGGVANE